MPKKSDEEMIEGLSLNGLIFNAAAMEAIAAASRPGYEFKSNAVYIGPDQYYVPLDQETMKRLREHKLPGESPSDTVMRILAKAKGLQ